MFSSENVFLPYVFLMIAWSITFSWHILSFFILVENSLITVFSRKIDPNHNQIFQKQFPKKKITVWCLRIRVKFLLGVIGYFFNLSFLRNACCFVFTCMPMWKWKSLQKWKSLMNLDYQHHAIVLDMIAVR
jgi:hypothetical protein